MQNLPFNNFTPVDQVSFALYALVWLVAFLAGVAVGSVISAIWLRLAVQWLGFAPISYLAAFKSALISNFSVVMIQVAVGFNHGLTMGMSGLPQRGMDPRFHMSQMSNFYQPTYFLCAIMIGLVVMAAIFSRTIPPKQEPAMNFTQALSIAAFHQALSLVFMAILALIAYLIAVGWTNMF